MKKNGFTLVELIAVLVILSIIAILAAPNIVSLMKSSKDKSFISEVEELVTTATYMYKSEAMKAQNFVGDEETGYTIYMNKINGTIPTNDPYGYAYILDSVDNDGSYIKFTEPGLNETNGSRKVYVHIKSCNANSKCHYVCGYTYDKLKVEDTCPAM